MRRLTVTLDTLPSSNLRHLGLLKNKIIVAIKASQKLRIDDGWMLAKNYFLWAESSAKIITLYLFPCLSVPYFYFQYILSTRHKWRKSHLFSASTSFAVSLKYFLSSSWRKLQLWRGRDGGGGFCSAVSVVIVTCTNRNTVQLQIATRLAHFSCLWICGSGFANPDPDLDPDPAIFVIDLHDANKKLIKKILLITFWRCI